MRLARVARGGTTLDRRPPAGLPCDRSSDLFDLRDRDGRSALRPAIGISVLSGAVRGFSGFGSALIYVPLMS